MTKRTAELDQSFWEGRWASALRADPDVVAPMNRTLTETAGQLSAGSALDAGCGNGNDAIWLAERGWTVTAVDFVASALERGCVRADRCGPHVADRIDWLQADLSTWGPPVEAFDLVSAHYVHGVAQRSELFGRLATAVRPGGTLLIVGHHPSNADVSGGTVPGAVFFTTADVLAVLDDGWELVTVADDVARRDAVGLDGRPVTLRSAVVRARRR